MSGSVDPATFPDVPSELADVTGLGDVPGLSGVPELGDVSGLGDTVELDRVKAATYTGRDPEHLVTASVDGDGLVSRIRFAASVGTRAPEAVEAAVITAVAAAQRQLDEAWRDLAAQIQPQPDEPDRRGENDGA
jgi:DNA-binding protein YbaB